MEERKVEVRKSDKNHETPVPEDDIVLERRHFNKKLGQRFSNTAVNVDSSSDKDTKPVETDDELNELLLGLESIEDYNNAVRSFLDKRLIIYNETYDINTLIYLVQTEPYPVCIKYVFNSGVYESFIKQLWHLNSLANHFGCPAIFISPEPSISENSNYIVGVVFKNQLLIISPDGEVLEEKMAKILMLVSDQHSDYHFINRVYVSTNIIQCDSPKQCSRGPICVEILFTLTGTIKNIEIGFDKWSHIQDEMKKESYKLEYFPLDIASFLSDELLGLKLLTVVPQIEKIRHRHLTYLKNAKSQDSSVEDQNCYLSEVVLGAPDQLLVVGLTQMEISWLTPDLKVLHQKLQFRLSRVPTIPKMSEDDQKKAEPNIIQMCESITMLSSYIKRLIKWFDVELIQYFQALYSVKSYVFRNELHPDAAYSEEEKERRCIELFDILSSEILALNTKYTYTPALKQSYDFSKDSERQLFLKTKVHLTKGNRDLISFGRPEDAIELGAILSTDDCEILTHLAGYTEPGIQYALSCGHKSALEEFIQAIIKVISINSMDFDIKLEGIVCTVNLARHLISMLNDIRSIIRRDCFFISNTLPLFTHFRGFGEHYDFHLVSQLKDKNPKSFESKIFYIDKNRHFYFKNESEEIIEDDFPNEINEDFQYYYNHLLENKSLDSNVQRNRKKVPLQHLTEEDYDPENVFKPQRIKCLLLNILSIKGHIRRPRIFEVADGVNQQIAELDQWYCEDKSYRDLRGVFVQYTVPTLSQNTQVLLERVYESFALHAPLKDFINKWVNFHNVFNDLQKLKEKIFSSKKIGLHKLKDKKLEESCPLNVIDPRKLSIMSTMENARSSLETIIGPIHDALFAEPDSNYRTRLNLLRFKTVVPPSDRYDERLRKEFELENPARHQSKVSALSPRSTPPGTPVSPRKQQSIPRPDSPRGGSTASPPAALSPRRNTSPSHLSVANAGFVNRLSSTLLSKSEDKSEDKEFGPL